MVSGYPASAFHTRRRVTRAIQDDDLGSIKEGGALEEVLVAAPQTGYYYFYPYFRLRKVSRRRYDYNGYKSQKPFSNYADEYDRFPTVA